MWKPRHEAHAIERVRLLFTFREPIPSKVVAKSSYETRQQASDLGFDAVGPAESSIATIKLQARNAPQTEPSAQNGFVMRRHQDGALVEEIGFRDMVYGYMTKTYGRWESLVARLEEALLPALNNISDIAELDAVKLEYWDSFVFEGDPLEADVSKLLSVVDAAIPSGVRAGSSAWHSHVGWFEGDEESPTLINRNIDVVDTSNEEGQNMRSLGIYTLVERRSKSTPIDFQGVQDLIDGMHNRSLLLFGESLSEEYRNQIGINLEAYK
ncbi:MAG: TIGR04255 family protein [Alteromonadaceae bacterium]|nr:TIGR04255 family protein [Alteromonadaceae bacterium]